MGVLTATRPEPLCPTPLELRALTSPETRDALAAVADAFRTSQEDLRPLGGRPAGCYQINVTVQAAPSDQTVAAFSDSAAWAEPQLACPQPGSTASPCPEPLRDVGPHPDVWLPASATEYQRVADAVRRPESAVSLGVPFTVARSPAVLAVSRRDGLTGRARAGETDADLVRAATAQGFTVRGAAPLSSDTALVHALHLPAGTGTDDPAPRGDDTAVICDAATATGQRRALLITEAEAAALFDPTMPGRPSCLGQYADPYTAYYPRDVPGLDLTFVPVTWRDAHADTAQRTEAVRRFAQWLRSPDGLRELGREGFRGADPKARPTTAPLLRDVFVRDPGPPPPPPPAADVDALVRRYGQPGGRRDVLFAVDVSTSSYSGSRAATIRSVLSAAVGGLAADDRYGIAAIPGSTGTDGHPAAPLPLGTHPAADAHRAIGALTAVDDDAPIAAALTGWSDQLARDHAGLPLLVLITDDEDSRGISRPPRGDVPVVVVSTEEFGCKLDFNIELTRAKGACLDASQDLPGRIGRTIAQLTATGGTG
nr:substrate-binding domain-containing protein [Streptomyces sp. SID5468]